MEDWENTWQMSFYPSKCSTFGISQSKGKGVFPTTHHLHGQQLVVASSRKYLAVTITDDLSWANLSKKQDCGLLPDEIQRLRHYGQVRHLRHYGSPCTGGRVSCLGYLQAERRSAAWKGAYSVQQQGAPATTSETEHLVPNNHCSMV